MSRRNDSISCRWPKSYFFTEDITGGFGKTHALTEERSPHEVVASHEPRLLRLNRSYYENVKDFLSSLFDQIHCVKTEREHARKQAEIGAHFFDQAIDDILQQRLFKLQKAYRMLYEDAGCTCHSNLNLILAQQKNSKPKPGDNSDEENTESVTTNSGTASTANNSSFSQ